MSRSSVTRQIDLKLIKKWKESSKTKLKEKSSGNIKVRTKKLEEAVNNAIINITHNLNIIPFNVSLSLLHNAEIKLFGEINKWQGVNVMIKQNVPKTWKEYHVTADNWWNRNKAKWIGDYFFAPILKYEIFKYCKDITKQYYINNNSDIMITSELLYFSSISNIMKELYFVKFHRTKRQPLLFDQSFKLSKLMRELFIKLGIDHGLEWNIDRNLGALAIRHYVQEWIENIITMKKEIYERIHNQQPPLTQISSIDTHTTEISDNSIITDDKEQEMKQLYAEGLIVMMDDKPISMTIPNHNNYYRKSGRERERGRPQQMPARIALPSISGLSPLSSISIPILPNIPPPILNNTPSITTTASSIISSSTSIPTSISYNGYHRAQSIIRPQHRIYSVENQRYHPYETQNNRHRIMRQRQRQQFESRIDAFEWTPEPSLQTVKVPLNINNMDNNYYYDVRSSTPSTTYQHSVYQPQSQCMSIISSSGNSSLSSITDNTTLYY